MFNEILTDENLNFNEVEKKVFNFVTMLGRMIIKNILETRDQEIAKSRDKKKLELAFLSTQWVSNARYN